MEFETFKITESDEWPTIYDIHHQGTIWMLNDYIWWIKGDGEEGRYSEKNFIVFIQCGLGRSSVWKVLFTDGPAYMGEVSANLNRRREIQIQSQKEKNTNGCSCKCARHEES